MTSGRSVVIGCVVVLVVAIGAILWRSRKMVPTPSPVPVASTTTSSLAPSASPGAAKLAALAVEIGPDATSPIANELNAPNGTIRRDLELLNDVFVAWQTNFPREGNPVGENDEITLALAGANKLHFAFVAPNHRAINAAGELCDRWGTPFRFHQLSGTTMEIRSAGPDRKFATADDVQFAP